MQCEIIQAELFDLDHDSAGRERVRNILAHLAGCAACRAAMDDFDRLRNLSVMKTETEPAGGWAAFEGRMIRTLGTPRTRWSARLGFAIAASIMLCAVGLMIYLQSRHHVSLKQEFAAAEPLLKPPTRQEIAQNVTLFHQISDVFNGRTSWVMTGNDSSDLGLQSEASGSSPLLMVRLTASRGGRFLSNADLIIIAGHSAEISVQGKSGAKLNYHIITSPSDPTRLQVYAEVVSPSHPEQTEAVLATDLRVISGQPTRAGEVATPAGPCQIDVGVYPAERAVQPS